MDSGQLRARCNSRGTAYFEDLLKLTPYVFCHIARLSSGGPRWHLTSPYEGLCNAGGDRRSGSDLLS